MRAHRAASAALLLLVVALAIAIPLAVIGGFRSGSDPALADAEARQRAVVIEEQGSVERPVAMPVAVEDRSRRRAAPEPSAEAQRSSRGCVYARHESGVHPGCLQG